MTDKELLELAAKAAGRTWLSYHHTKGLCCRDDSYGGLIEYYWNPLTDNGDALRLAVKLKISPIYGFPCVAVCAFARGESHHADPYEATRRAITRTAAEIGKSIK